MTSDAMTPEVLGTLTEEEHTTLRETHQRGQQLISHMGEISYHLYRIRGQKADSQAQLKVMIAELESRIALLGNQEKALDEKCLALCQELEKGNTQAQEMVQQIMTRLGLPSDKQIVVQPDGQVIEAPSRS